MSAIGKDLRNSLLELNNKLNVKYREKYHFNMEKKGNRNQYKEIKILNTEAGLEPKFGGNLLIIKKTVKMTLVILYLK